ncbi:hypothetical protein PGB34_22545 [Xenophilus arseniciresistens]|uniref:Uncharacterized protein n=1 Tax=Xenophilus arseniciresistens TaxID=1283306 RepID=A0AAE3T1D7_9BURK|nr:hypothetical protein [Xenophilus arseniciresistens]MDA7419162.1 hypothetical protein [Xenophilus arseniciresistens]
MNTRLFSDAQSLDENGEPVSGNWLQTLREADARRADLPGEHVIVLGLGVLALLAAGRSRSVGGRLLKAAVGGALIGRAASGTGGLTRLAAQATQLADRYLPR